MREKRVCKSREEMLMQGMCEEEVVLADTLVDVGIVDISSE
jgi:hypothetical protein